MFVWGCQACLLEMLKLWEHFPPVSTRVPNILTMMQERSADHKNPMRGLTHIPLDADQTCLDCCANA